MPEHIDESRLLRMVAGELSAAEHEDLSGHLLNCAACRARHAAMRATWDLLGEWQPAAPDRDLAGVVRARAADRPAPRRVWATAGRLAAAVALAVTIGVAAGRLAPVPTATARGPEVISDEHLAAVLGLDVLGEPAAFSGLFEPIADADETPEEVPS